MSDKLTLPKSVEDAILNYAGALVYDHGGATIAAAVDKNRMARQIALDALRASISAAIAEGRDAGLLDGLGAAKEAATEAINSCREDGESDLRSARHRTERAIQEMIDSIRARGSA